MKNHVRILLAVACLAMMIMAASCTTVDFNNPLDPSGTDYLWGDPSCEAEKTTDYEGGAGLFTRPELTEGCGQ